MITLIQIDLKQRIKSPLTWFIIFILLTMSILSIIEVKEARLNRPFKGHDVYMWERGSIIDLAKIMDEKERAMYPEVYLAHYMRTKVQEDVIKANEENDIKEITRLLTFYHLINAKGGYVTNDPIGNMVFYNKVIEIWNDVSGGIPYEDINFYPIYSYHEVKTLYLLYAKYYYQLYINDFEPIYSDDINNVTCLYNYFFDIIPKFIVIIPIIFIYNVINKDKNTGSLKLILTQSISRKKCYISKWISGVIHITFVLYSPAIIIGIISGLANGFVSFNYPVIYLKGSVTSFKSIPNYFDAIKEQLGYHFKFGYNKTFINYAPISNLAINDISPHEKMEIIPFYQYMLMVILLTILFITFAVALIQLVSAIVDNEIISFTVAVVVFILGSLISSPFKYDKHLNLSPFTMEHASRIVIGTYNVTALTSTIILLGATIFLLIIGCRYFKKKGI